MQPIADLTEYLAQYGKHLGKQAARATEPLHDPAVDYSYAMTTLRQPYEPQAHVITAGVKTLHRQKAILLSGECGVGKTLCGQMICHAHAKGMYYRALVFCPSHLCQKWERELRATIPGVQVFHIKSYKDVTGLRGQEHTGPAWYIVSQTTAKLDCGWRAAYMMRRGTPHCCSCFQPIDREKKGEWGGTVYVPITEDELAKKPLFCRNCGETLWQYKRQFDRWPVAKYIHKKLKGYFQYFIIDEAHQEQGEDSAQANAVGSLAAAIPYTIAMSGTLLNGYANSLRTMLFRLAPGSLTADGFAWTDRMPFSERYGRIEKRIIQKNSVSHRNMYSRGSSTRTQKYLRPGVMPNFFGDHLIDKCIFLRLSDVADNLPPLDEEIVPVTLDPEQLEAYAAVEMKLKTAIKGMVAKGDRRLLASMLQTLLGYPDRPFGWETIGYHEDTQNGASSQFIPVVTPPSLSEMWYRPKELALLEHVDKEIKAGRQAWVFNVMTERRDVAERLRQMFENYGLKAKLLRAGTVATREREAWIEREAPGTDVIISHPQLVETGLDLLNHTLGYNFCSLFFYSTGYNLNTMRQASRRHWRLTQDQACRTFYFYYQGTMQARALTLMGRKLMAAESIEGKFSAEGLAALAGEEGSMEMALARSLVENLGDLDVAKAWGKVKQELVP